MGQRFGALQAVIALTAAVAMVAGVVAGGCASPPQTTPAGAPMTLAQYARVVHDSPYAFTACVKGTALTYLGVRHSRVLGSEPIAAVVREFAHASPTLVLVEGQVPWVSPSFEHAVATWGEPGAAAFLAREKGLPVESLDRPLDEEAHDLRRTFGHEPAIAFYGLRILAQERSQAGLDADEFLRQRLLPWMRRNAITSELVSLGEFRALAQRVTGLDDAVEAAQASWFSPLAPTDRFGFRTIAGHLVNTRDVHMAQQLVAALRRGQRAFAVAGHSHVVMQEPALRHALGCEPPRVSPDGRRVSPSLARCDQTCERE